MGSSENLLKAVINRLSLRLGARMVNTAAEISDIAKEAPDRLKAEWEVLKEEIITEANRLELENQEKAQQESSQKNSEFNHQKSTIDQIRSKVLKLTREIEDRS